MLASQNFESYPKLAGDGVRQSTNYALGGGGTSTTKQFRPASTTQPAKKQQITQPGQSEPQINVAKPPPPGVATQAPSPTAASPFGAMAGAIAGQGGALLGGGAKPTPTASRPVLKATPAAIPAATALQHRAESNPFLQANRPKPASTPKPVLKASPPAQTPANSTPATGEGIPGAPTKFNVESLIAQLVGNPSQQRRQGMQEMFGRLTGDMSERLNEDAASRGLEFTSVPTELFARESGELAGRMTEQEGIASAEDYRTAVDMAQRFGQQGIENQFKDRGMDLDEELGRGSLDLNRELGRGELSLSRDRFGLDKLNSDRDWQQTGFLNDLGLRDQDLEEMLAGHGMSQDEFGNSMTTRNQRLRELQVLMGMGDYAQAPLGTAVGAGFDYSGALGGQAAGSASAGSELAALIPFLTGANSGTPGGGTPPITPRPATFGNSQGGTYGITSGRRY